MKNHLLIVLLMCVAFLNFRCTRPQSETSVVQMSLPYLNTQKVSNALSSTEPILKHVVINVSGPGMSRMVCNLDVRSEDNSEVSSGPCLFNYPYVKIEVPSGNQRLIQVVLVNESSGVMSFMYGDASKDLAGGSSDIGIRLVSLNQTSTSSGDIMGRYLSAADTGPTGVVSVNYRPDASKPPITIMRSEIFNGWFKVFSLSNIAFEYMVNDSFMLFDKSQTLENFISMADTLPSVDKKIYADGSRQKYVVQGFFGSVSSDKITCTAGDSNCVIGGSSIEYVNHLYTDSSQFFGPFKKSSGKTLNISGNYISWSYVPGAETVLDGVKLYYAAAGTYDTNALPGVYIEEDLIDCSKLENLSGVKYVDTLNSSVTSYTFSNAYAVSQSSLIVLCPFKKDYTYHSVASNLLGSQNNGNSPYVRIEIISGGTYSSDANGNYSVYSSTCYGIRAGSYSYDGVTASAYPVSVATNIDIVSNASFYIYESLSYCNASASPSLGQFSLAANASISSETKYIKFMSNGTINLSLSIVGESLTFSNNYNQFIATAPP